MNFQDTKSLWAEIADGIPAEQRALLQRAFRAIARGQPLPLATAQRDLRMDAEAFHRTLGTLVEAGLVTTDRLGHAIDGAWGLSLAPSRHQLALGERRFHVWCALDAVGIPAALGADAEIRSHLEGSGEPVAIRIQRGHVVHATPADVVVSLPRPDLDQSFVDANCAVIGFYRRADAPRAEGVAVLSLDEAGEVGRVVWKGAAP